MNLMTNRPVLARRAVCATAIGVFVASASASAVADNIDCCCANVAGGGECHSDISVELCDELDQSPNRICRPIALGACKDCCNCPEACALNCDDNNPCTDDSCMDGGCLHVNNTDSCDDNNACTDNDLCSGGTCSGTLACDDGLGCTTDTCDPAAGCMHSDTCTGGAECCGDDCCSGPCHACVNDLCIPDQCEYLWLGCRPCQNGECVLDTNACDPAQCMECGLTTGLCAETQLASMPTRTATLTSATSRPSRTCSPAEALRISRWFDWPAGP